MTYQSTDIVHLKRIRECVLQIVDPDTREKCGPNQEGEICSKADGTSMMGYLNQPRETYFDQEGFGMTGDLGYYDQNGALHYVDRMKELIKFCNNHVSPTQLEDILQSHPFVRESLVFGIQEPSLQELVSAVVVLNDEANSLSELDVKEYVNARVDADYKKIRGKVIFRKCLPRNTMGKLLRREMRKWAEEQSRHCRM